MTPIQQEQIAKFDEKFAMISDFGHKELVRFLVHNFTPEDPIQSTDTILYKAIKDFLLSSMERAAEEATKVERDSWLNQKANEHDKRIREDERKKCEKEQGEMLDILERSIQEVSKTTEETLRMVERM